MILGSGKFIYFETSYPAKTGDKAVLQSATIKAGSQTKCLFFAYHMFGNSMEQLKLDIVHSDNTRKQLFQNVVSKNAWVDYAVSLIPQKDDYQVKIYSRDPYTRGSL